jgi:hypothetical protein
MRSFILIILICFPFWMACNKGLAPPEDQVAGLNFSIPPLGGNPIGLWSPDTTRSVDVFIANPEEIPTFIDSLILDPSMSGSFSFFSSGACSTDAILTIIPSVYLAGLTTPLVLTIQDTLRGQGPFDIPNDRVLFMPLSSSLFRLDTLGFSQYENTLDLISLPNTFPDPAFNMVFFTFVFHLKRDPGTTSAMAPFAIVPEKHILREDCP